METKKLFSGLGWGYILFMALSLGMQSMIVLILRLTGLKVSVNILMLLSELAMYGWAFPLFYQWMKRYIKWPPARRGKLTPGQFFLWLIFSLGSGYIGNLIGQFLMKMVSLMTGTPIDNPVDLMISELNIVYLFLFVVIVAPLMEELMFRKLLIDRIIPYGQKTAILVSGLAFGLFHGNFYQFFYACALGMIFAYLYTKTGSMWYGVAIHAIINFAGGVLPAATMTQVEGGNPLAAAVLSLYGILILGSIIAAVVLIFCYSSKARFFPGWAEDTGTGLWKKILSAPGVIFYLIMCLFMFRQYI